MRPSLIQWWHYQIFIAEIQAGIQILHKWQTDFCMNHPCLLSYHLTHDIAPHETPNDTWHHIPHHHFKYLSFDIVSIHLQFVFVSQGFCTNAIDSHLDDQLVTGGMTSIATKVKAQTALTIWQFVSTSRVVKFKSRGWQKKTFVNVRVVIWDLLSNSEFSLLV